VAGWPGGYAPGAHVKGGHWGKKTKKPTAMEHVIIPGCGTRFPTHLDFLVICLFIYLFIYF
jgi:hypothetical protein